MTATVPLSEVIRSAGRRAGAATDVPVYSVTKHSGFVPSLEYFKKQVFSRDTEGYKLVEPGHFAYATIHLDEGSIGIAPERALISPMYTVFSVDESRVVPEYLIRFLKSPRALSYYPHLGKGAVHRRKSISLSALGTLPLPLPPIEEQRRIAAILDQADAVRTKRQQVLAHFTQLTRADLLRLLACEFKRVPFGDLIADGPKNGLYRPASDYGSGTPIVRIDSFKFGSPAIAYDGLRRLRAPDAQIDEFALAPGDLLINRVNSREHVGKTALVDALPEPMVFESNMMRVRVNADELEPVFMAEFMQTQDVRAQVAPMTKDAVNQSSINQVDVRSILVPLPPIDLQREFADRAATINAQRAVVDRAFSADDELFASLQSRAFRGEL